MGVKVASELPCASVSPRGNCQRLLWELGQLACPLGASVSPEGSCQGPLWEGVKGAGGSLSHLSAFSPPCPLPQFPQLVSARDPCEKRLRGLGRGVSVPLPPGFQLPPSACLSFSREQLSGTHMGEIGRLRWGGMDPPPLPTHNPLCAKLGLGGACWGRVKQAGCSESHACGAAAGFQGPECPAPVSHRPVGKQAGSCSSQGQGPASDPSDSGSCDSSAPSPVTLLQSQTPLQGGGATQSPPGPCGPPPSGWGQCRGQGSTAPPHTPQCPRTPHGICTPPRAPHQH